MWVTSACNYVIILQHNQYNVIGRYVVGSVLTLHVGILVFSPYDASEMSLICMCLGVPFVLDVPYFFRGRLQADTALNK